MVDKITDKSHDRGVYPYKKHTGGGELSLLSTDPLTHRYTGGQKEIGMLSYPHLTDTYSTSVYIPDAWTS